MRRHEQQFIAEARAKAKAEIEAAQKNLKDLEAALFFEALSSRAVVFDAWVLAHTYLKRQRRPGSFVSQDDALPS